VLEALVVVLPKDSSSSGSVSKRNREGDRNASYSQYCSTLCRVLVGIVLDWYTIWDN